MFVGLVEGLVFGVDGLVRGVNEVLGVKECTVTTRMRRKRKAREDIDVN